MRLRDYDSEDLLPTTVELVHPFCPELPRHAVEQAILSVVKNGATLRLLQVALEKLPGLLVGGQSNVPVTAGALCHALVAAGAARVVLPTCESCGRAEFLPHKTANGGRHCSRCERNHRSVECSQCGRIRPIQRRIDGAKICRDCWRQDPRSMELCSQCGELATVVVRRPDVVCLGCYQAPIKRCGICDEDGRVAMHVEGTRVCARCYYTMRRARLCPECGDRRLLTHQMHGELVCASCAGAPALFACPGCGSVEESREHRLCVACRRPITIKILLSDEDGNIRDELQPLAEHLLTHHRRADSLIRWVSKSATASLLRSIARGDLPLTADAIIANSSGQSAAFLLSLLGMAGVFDGVDVARLRFEHWYRQWIPTLPRADRLIIRQYAEWGRLAQTASPLPVTFSVQRIKLLHCAAVLSFIREAGHTLATFPQRQLDQYALARVSRRDALAPFMRWLRRNQLSHLHVEGRKTELQGIGYESDTRWRMAQYFLHTADIDPRDRVAGLLVLFYGMQVTRVARIRTAQFQDDANGMTLTVGAEPIQLPSAVGQAIRVLIEADRPRATPWLFPGRNPGQHLTPGVLTRRLNGHGLDVLSSRVTALMELAAEIPPRILADLLGIDVSTASAWWRLAGGDWIEYPALRR